MAAALPYLAVIGLAAVASLGIAQVWPATHDTLPRGFDSSHRDLTRGVQDTGGSK